MIESRTIRGGDLVACRLRPADLGNEIYVLDRERYTRSVSSRLLPLPRSMIRNRGVTGLGGDGR